MFCGRCGKLNQDDAQFCRGCGERVDPSTESQAPTVSVPPSAVPITDVPAAVVHALAGSHEVTSLLGRGGMGAVYLAREIALDRLVAIKVLPSDQASDKDRVKRFLQEARLAAKLRHPNIVAIHGVGEKAGVYYFTMDYVDGRTLDLEVQPAVHKSLEDTGRIFLDVCRAVAHAHRHGIVHRDLKPSNVMLDTSGHVFVMDFGLAKAVDSAGLTASNAVPGTPRYMSPEQIEGKPASPRSDIYALGLIGYFLLAGECLISADSISGVIAQHLAGGLASRLASDHRVPQAVRPLLAAMVERDPARRPGSVEEVIARLPVAIASAHEHATETRTTTLPGPIPPTAPGSGSVPGIRRRARERMKSLLDRHGKDGKDG